MKCTFKWFYFISFDSCLYVRYIWNLLIPLSYKNKSKWSDNIPLRLTSNPSNSDILKPLKTKEYDRKYEWNRKYNKFYCILHLSARPQMTSLSCLLRFKTILKCYFREIMNIRSNHISRKSIQLTGILAVSCWSRVVSIIVVYVWKSSVYSILFSSLSLNLSEIIKEQSLRCVMIIK